jgi:hypothetical protein
MEAAAAQLLSLDALGVTYLKPPRHIGKCSHYLALWLWGPRQGHSMWSAQEAVMFLSVVAGILFRIFF